MLEEDLSRFLVIGGAGLLGAEVVKALGAGQCVVASRHAGERVDIADPRSLAALFDRVGEVDGIVCTGGAARFRPWDQLTDDDWAFSVANKLMGQINVVRLGANRVRRGGAITLTSGLAAQYPAPGSAIITTVNAAVEAFVRAVAVEPAITARVNAVSPGGSPRRCKLWGAIRPAEFRRGMSRRSSCANCARARRARSRRRRKAEV